MERECGTVGVDLVPEIFLAVLGSFAAMEGKSGPEIAVLLRKLRQFQEAG